MRVLFLRLFAFLFGSTPSVEPPSVAHPSVEPPSEGVELIVVYDDELTIAFDDGDVIEGSRVWSSVGRAT